MSDETEVNSISGYPHISFEIIHKIVHVTCGQGR